MDTLRRNAIGDVIGASPAGGASRPDGALVLDALHAATVAVASETELDAVLALIVERVRPLVGARYAALGIVDRHGDIERFVTAGMDAETQRKIGARPRGHGLIGLIIRENRAIRVSDVMTDERRHGFPPHHPDMHTFLGVPVPIQGRSAGNLYLTEKEGGVDFTDDDLRIVELFARHAGIAIHNARLRAEVEHLAIGHERERIGQDLHDGIIQSLYAVGLSLEDVGELMHADPTDAEARVERAIESIHSTIRDLRSFIFGLRPDALEDSDLESALLAMAEELGRSTLMDVDVRVDAEATRLDPEVTVQLLHLAREALSNVARHAAANRVRVRAASKQGGFVLEIEDDGRGFDPAVNPGHGHHGLANMRSRTEALGGTFQVESEIGTGTTVRLRLPMTDATRPTEAME